jgi:hypothetical protein
MQEIFKSHNLLFNRFFIEGKELAYLVTSNEGTSDAINIYVKRAENGEDWTIVDKTLMSRFAILTNTINMAIKNNEST